MMNGKELLSALGTIFEESNEDLKITEKQSMPKSDTDTGEDLEIDTTQKVIKLRKKRIVKLKPKVDPEAERKLEPELPVGLTDENIQKCVPCSQYEYDMAKNGVLIERLLRIF